MDLARALEETTQEARMDAYFASAEGARPFYAVREECIQEYIQSTQTQQNRRFFFKAEHFADREQ